MRDALLITFLLVFIFVVVGVIYNMLTPYLLKFGVSQDFAQPRKDGGVFRSQDFGRNWSNIKGSDKLLRSNTSGIYFDPNDTSSMYAATSEGLFKTNDAGESWGSVSLEFINYSTAFSQDPNNTKRMYVAGSGGGAGRILKARVDEFYEVYSGVGDEILGVWVDPLDSVNIYAGTKNGLLLESLDFGESWRVKREFDAAFEDLLILEGSMYATVGGDRLLVSRNRGASWSDITPLVSDIRQVIVSPHDERVLYLTSSGGLFVSKNSGASFSKIDILSEDASKLSAVALDAQKPDVLYIGIGNQVHKSDDGGSTWQIKTLNTQRNITLIKVRPDRSSTVFVGVSGGL